MNDDPVPCLRKCWRPLVSFAMVASIALIIFLLLSFTSIGRGISEASARRVAPGMMRAEVKDLLGVPNPMPDLMRKNEEFWDGEPCLGFRYVSVHVEYDADGRVVTSKVRAFWTTPRWKLW